MSTPIMNHNSHMHQQQEQQQQQQQQQQINETQQTHLNLADSTHATLIRSDSTSTVILEEDETLTCRRNGLPTRTPLGGTNLTTQLRSFLKTSGLFNKDLESSDKLNELFADGNEFTLYRLLSEAVGNDINLNTNDFMKFDSMKFPDSRTLSEFLRSESFDQLIASAVPQTDISFNPSAINSSTMSFSELRPVSPELTTDNNNYSTEPNQLKIHSHNDLVYDSVDSSTPMQVNSPYSSNQGALNAFEHDHAFLSKRIPTDETPTSTSSKRTATRGQRRTSSRIQSRAVRTTSSEVTSTKTKGSRNVNRANDIKTPEDLSYYLERRRKNNEASKVSRAARKQKFGDMDQKCAEYERVNAELRMKILTLEAVTTSLKSGLVNNFQRKPSV